MHRLLPIVISLLLVPAAAAPAAVSDRDRTFNFTGQVLFDDGGADIGHDVALQPDGKLVMISDTSSTESGIVRRLLPDGSLDDRFGTQGAIKIKNGNSNERLRAVAVQPDGKILVGGSSAFRPVVYRFDSHGRPDATWGPNGRRQLSEGVAAVNALALQPDGKVIAAGGTGDGQAGTVWRLTPGGDPDLTFNTTGQFATAPNGVGFLDAPTDVAIQPDGKIVVAGFSQSKGNGWVMRLNPNTGVDIGFNGGFTPLDEGGVEVARAVELMPDGRIVVAGDTTVNGNGVVWRLRSNGKLDTSFNESGAQVIDSAGTEHLRALLVQSDGKIVAVGETSVDHDGAFYRLTESGQFDPSFDGDGAIGVDAGGIETLNGAVLQPDGNMVAVGRAGPNADAAVFRLLGDPHRLTVHTVGAGAVSCGGPCAPAYDVGTTVTLTATPAAGAAFTGWTGCASAEGAVCRVTMSGPRVVTATFAAKPSTPGGGQPDGGGRPGGGQPGGGQPGGGQPGGGGSTPPADRVAPRLRGARIVAGARVRFVLSEPAKVTVRVGRKAITRSLRAGLREVRLGKVKRGRHKVTLRAVDAGGNRSKTVKLTLKR